MLVPFVLGNPGSATDFSVFYVPGLSSLVRLRLECNNLETLNPSDLDTFPRPLTLYLSDQRPYRPTCPGNPWTCDRGLCWLRREQLSGRVRFALPGTSEEDYPYRPKCSNAVDWDSWQCSAQRK